jgi:hypothetical protein
MPQNLLEGMKDLYSKLEDIETQDVPVIDEAGNDRTSKLENLEAQLNEIREHMLEEIKRADKLLKSTVYYNKAKAYWIAHIMSALGSHEYYTHATTFEKTLSAISDDIDMKDPELPNYFVHGS